MRTSFNKQFFWCMPYVFEHLKLHQLSIQTIFHWFAILSCWLLKLFCQILRTTQCKMNDLLIFRSVSLTYSKFSVFLIISTSRFVLMIICMKWTVRNFKTSTTEYLFTIYGYVFFFFYCMVLFAPRFYWIILVWFFLSYKSNYQTVYLCIFNTSCDLFLKYFCISILYFYTNIFIFLKLFHSYLGHIFFCIGVYMIHLV